MLTHREAPTRAWRAHGARVIRRVVLPSLLLSGIAGAVASLLPRTYVAEGSFVPEGGQAALLPSSLAGLTSQFNLSSLNAGERNADSYGEIITSRTLLDQLAEAPLADSDSLVALTTYYGHQDEATWALAIYKTRQDIEANLRVQINRVTGQITVQFGARDPVLAASVVNQLISLANEFNLVSYRTSAKARREFSERRFAEVEKQLRAAEEEWAEFAKRNRSVESSPELRLTADRLQRALRIQEGIYTQLSQALEDARMEEVRDTPVLTVIDAAVPPPRASAPRPVLAALAVLVAAFTLLVLREFRSAMSLSPPDTSRE